MIAAAYLLHGAIEQARHRLELAELLRPDVDPVSEQHALAIMAEVYWWLEDFEAAKRLITSIIELLRQRGASAALAFALTIRERRGVPYRPMVVGVRRRRGGAPVGRGDAAAQHDRVQPGGDGPDRGGTRSARALRGTHRPVAAADRPIRHRQPAGVPGRRARAVGYDARRARRRRGAPGERLAARDRPRPRPSGRRALRGRSGGGAHPVRSRPAGGAAARVAGGARRHDGPGVRRRRPPTAAAACSRTTSTRPCPSSPRHVPRTRAALMPFELGTHAAVPGGGPAAGPSSHGRQEGSA